MRTRGLFVILVAGLLVVAWGVAIAQQAPESGSKGYSSVTTKGNPPDYQQAPDTSQPGWYTPGVKK